jgi:hypothetical protein
MKVKLYNTYVFKDKDPAIDALRTAFQKTKAKRTKVALDANISTTTLHGWFDGKTRRPQFCTMVATARALGPEGVAALTNVIRRGK